MGVFATFLPILFVSTSGRNRNYRGHNHWNGPQKNHGHPLDAGYINDEMRFEVNAYNGMNEDIK